MKNFQACKVLEKAKNENVLEKFWKYSESRREIGFGYFYGHYAVPFAQSLSPRKYFVPQITVLQNVDEKLRDPE